MYFITNEFDLKDKVIAFTHFAQFADAMTIVTKDKGIMVFYQSWNEDGDDGRQTFVMNETSARNYVLKNEWIKKELQQLGIITQKDIEDYETEKRRIVEEHMKNMQHIQEERDRRKYEELKKKFENS